MGFPSTVNIAKYGAEKEKRIVEEKIVTDSSRVKYSNRILGRVVRNDVNVGPWEPFFSETQGIQTKEGLEDWLKKNGQKDDELNQVGFDRHVYEYGSGYQLWIPDEKDVTPTMVCVESIGVALTEGKAYEVTGIHGDTVVAIDDDGEEVEFMRERFKEIA